MGHLVWGMLVLMVMKIGQMYTTIQSAKFNAQAKMVHTLYSSTIDSHFGVIHHHIDSMLDQEVKEATLAYWALLQSEAAHGGDPTPRKKQDVKSACEDFLLDEFSLQVDFEVGDALDKLGRDGLVSREDDGTVLAASFADAKSRLKQKWAELFCNEENRGPDAGGDSDSSGSYTEAYEPQAPSVGVRRHQGKSFFLG